MGREGVAQRLGQQHSPAALKARRHPRPLSDWQHDLAQLLEGPREKARAAVARELRQGLHGVLVHLDDLAPGPGVELQHGLPGHPRLVKRLQAQRFQARAARPDQRPDLTSPANSCAHS